ncbi:MAG: xanthine dehydrogenase family protein molybdopterin-binding subunit, partial [Geminicoccaceae bacterium]
LSEHPEVGPGSRYGTRQVAKLGERIRRIEDWPLLRGEGRFAADISFPNQVHMRIVRSPIAYGRLKAVDVRAAEAMDGVIGALTGADVADLPPIDYRQVRVAGLDPYRQPILARDHVRYVGEPVAAIFAVDPWIGEDAEEQVVLDIEPLSPCLSATEPPIERDSGLRSEATVIEKAYGDLDQAFREAKHSLELELAIDRHSGVPLETRGAIARFAADKDRLELYGAAKIPHINRQAIARMLGLDEAKLHLFEGHVGGGFGIRGELYPEDVLVCLAALRLGRPIKWVEDRYEHLLAANHARDQVHKVKVAFDDRGFIHGLDDEFWTDQGAYVRTHAATVTDLTAAMLPGPYVIPAYRSIGHIRMTNKTPAGTYRAPGRYEGTFVRERIIDAIATHLGRDQIAVRRVNLIPKKATPFKPRLDALGTDVTYDSADFEGLLDHFLEHVGHDALERRLEARRRAGEWVGAGLGYFVEKSGLGPFEDARIEMASDGRVEIVSGVASFGQGVETVLAQICSAILGVAPERITVTHGQTDRIERGMGAFASRATVMAGSAVSIAAHGLRERLLTRASELLQTSPDALQIDETSVVTNGNPKGPSIALGAVVDDLTGGDGDLLMEKATFSSEKMTYPYGIHLAVVRVDPETLGIVVEQFAVAYDVGRAINPTLIEGQLAGGVAQGIGGALLEAFIYSDRGDPLAASFADYLIPTALEVPEIDFLVTEAAPSPINPLGIKGAGEGGITAVGAAIASAVDAAVQRRGLVDRLPITPDQLRSALRQK